MPRGYAVCSKCNTTVPSRKIKQHFCNVRDTTTFSVSEDMSGEVTKKRRKSDQGGVENSQPSLMVAQDETTTNSELSNLKELLDDLDEDDQKFVVNMVASIVTHTKNKTRLLKNKVTQEVMNAVSSLMQQGKGDEV